VFSHVPNGKVAEVARMLEASHAQENRKAAQAKATEIVMRLKELKLRTAAELVERRVVETLTYYAYPSTHWRQIRTNNPPATSVALDTAQSFAPGSDSSLSIPHEIGVFAECAIPLIAQKAAVSASIS
jgi:hypothetical protein